MNPIVILYNGRLIPERTYFKSLTEAMGFVKESLLPVVDSMFPELNITETGVGVWKVGLTGAKMEIRLLRAAPPTDVLSTLAKVIVNDPAILENR